MHFPRTASDTPSPNTVKAAGVGAQGVARVEGRWTILVAEDDADIRLMMKTLLLMHGYRVVEARDGQEAVDVATATRPDLILMDLQLPRLNGFAVARFVRTTDTLRDVPIVVVSAHDPVKHRGLAFAAGCNAYVQKPIEFDRLDELIVSLLPRD
jgi:chemosensory pili system protein ChpA (sensor histidine kinase/response regulator)